MTIFPYPLRIVTVISVIFLLFLSIGVSAQQVPEDTSFVKVKWEEFELIGPHNKLVNTHWFKLWYIPAAGILPIGYLLIKKDGEEVINPPTINCLPDQSLFWGQDLPTTNPAAIVATNNCPDGELTIEHISDVSNNGTGCSGNPLVITRTYRVTDACGHSASCTQNFTYTIDDESPTLSCPPDMTLQWGDPLPTADVSILTAIDNCTPTGDIVLTHQGDEDNGGLGCTGDPRIVFRTYQATDICGNTVSCTQDFTYTIDDESPTLSCPPDMTLQWGATIPTVDVSTLTSNDNCTPTGNIVLTHQGDEDNGGLGCTGDPRIVVRTYQAADVCGNTVSCTQNFTYAVDDESPTIFCPPNVVLDCTDDTDPSIIGEATATDNCTPPSEISIGYQDDISGLTECNQTGTILRTWVVVDNCGNSATCIQEITLEDNTAPIFINTPLDLTVDCNSIPPPFNIMASDNCSGESDITIDLVEDTGTGCPFEITRTWTATDACGNLNTYTQVITVEDNEAPTITCPVDVIVICGESTDPTVTGIPLISDFCTDFSFSFTDDYSNQIDCFGFIIRTFEVVDECGNLASCGQLLHIVNTGCDFNPDITVENASCAVADGEIVIDPVTGYTYNWSNGASGPLVSDLAAGTYTVTIVNDDLSCSQILPVTVPDAPPYDLILENVNHPSTSGANDGSIELSIADPNAFPPFIILLNGSNYGSTGAGNFIIENLTAGTYTVQVLDINGCPSTEVTVVLIDSIGLNFTAPGTDWILELTPIHTLPATWHKQLAEINQTNKLRENLLTYFENPLLEKDLEMHYVPKRIQSISGGLFILPNLLFHGGLEWYEEDASNILEKGQNTPIHLSSHFRGLQVMGGLRKYVDTGKSRLFFGTQASWRNLKGYNRAVIMNEPIIGLSQLFSDDYFDFRISSGWQFQISKYLRVEVEWQEKLDIDLNVKDADPLLSKRNYLLNLQYQFHTKW